jgi:hypothetical protein
MGLDGGSERVEVVESTASVWVSVPLSGGVLSSGDISAVVRSNPAEGGHGEPWCGGARMEDGLQHFKHVVTTL